MSYTARPHILHEATLPQLRQLQPNVAVLPWGATEAHNYHLPHGTDVIEAVAVASGAVEQANRDGARCVLLPAIPFGHNHAQLSQIATISLRASTQTHMIYDIADSLVRQGIDRLVIVNFHGGNEFKPLLRDVMADFPIFIVQVHAFALAPQAKQLIENPGDHADEFETSLLLHLAPEWVNMEAAGSGAATPSKLPALTTTPGVWAQRDWAALTADTGTGDPSKATAEKGDQILKESVAALASVLVELSQAQEGDFPFVLPNKK